MLFRTHLVFGFLVGLYALGYFEISNAVLFLASVLFFSIFVDIDHKKSFLGRKLFPISKTLNLVFGHRGIVHSLFFSVILFILIKNYNDVVGYGAIIGVISHLILDAITKNGVRPFWPWKFHIKGIIRTGGISENILFIIILLADLYILIIK